MNTCSTAPFANLISLKRRANIQTNIRFNNASAKINVL